MDFAYARRYLGSSIFFAFALIHYLLIGERRGYWANPFFDPVVAARAGIRGLRDYLRRADQKHVKTSAFFDPTWYAKTLEPSQTVRNPLSHFWTVGFAKGSTPAPDFDCIFFKDIVGVHVRHKKSFAYARIAVAAPDFPRNARDLAERQDRFYETIFLEVVSSRPAPLRPYLLFIQAAHDFKPSFDDARSFDIMLNHYDQRPSVDQSADHVLFQRGTKTTAIRKILEAAPDLLLTYRAVMFIDDDIDIDGASIDNAFGLFEANGLDLAQPSLTPDSHCAYKILKQPYAGRGVRRLTNVEIMMPIVSRRALQQCGFAFSACISGWGADQLLGKQVRLAFGETIALLSDVVAAHSRQTDEANGAFYRFLRLHGIEAAHELALIAKRHGTSVMASAIRLAPGPS